MQNITDANRLQKVAENGDFFWSHSLSLPIKNDASLQSITFLSTLLESSSPFHTIEVFFSLFADFPRGP